MKILQLNKTKKTKISFCLLISLLGINSVYAADNIEEQKNNNIPEKSIGEGINKFRKNEITNSNDRVITEKLKSEIYGIIESYNMEKGMHDPLMPTNNNNINNDDSLENQILSNFNYLRYTVIAETNDIYVLKDYIGNVISIDKNNNEKFILDKEKYINKLNKEKIEKETYKDLFEEQNKLKEALDSNMKDATKKVLLKNNKNGTQK